MILATVAAGVVHYIYGGIRPQVRDDRTTVTARVQVSVLLGLIVALKAIAYWFDRFALATSDNGIITGLTFTDVNAVLPAKSILAGIAVICSLLFFANIFRRSWVLPAAGTALLGLSSFLIAGVYPALIQQFQVKPTESSNEAPFIQRNIEATRIAYGLDQVEIRDYQATINTSAGQLAGDQPTISNIRLMDPNVLHRPSAIAANRPYYAFMSRLILIATPRWANTRHGRSVRELILKEIQIETGLMIILCIPTDLVCRCIWKCTRCRW